MSDTLLSGVTRAFDPVKVQWRKAVEESNLIPINAVAKSFGVTSSVAITKRLFEEIYPYSEDANRHIHFLDRIEDIIKGFKKAARFAAVEHVEFGISVPTVVDKKFSATEVTTRKSSRKKDKKVTVYATSIPDDKGLPAVVFGLVEVA